MFEASDILIIIILLANLALTYFLKSSNSLDDQFQKNRSETSKMSKENREELASTLERFEERLSKSLKNVQESIEKQLKDIRDDNAKQLDKMRNTVDEKLQTTLEKRIGESFKLVSERLEEVHKGLGEMQTIAAGVGDLKKVLSNVKNRGVFGEYQLANILEQLLTPEQFSSNVATNPDYNGHVEFAVKLPGSSKDESIWLPIDSKFPIESYDILIDEYEKGNKDAIQAARKTLIVSIERFAKDISEKYVSPPNTTDFAIMFLPIEGLFAEVLREPGILETVRQKYNITITGPTTLSALLNSLQMGFKTLVMQKRSSEAWKVLSAVKAEFNTFGKQLNKVRSQLNTASSSLENLQETRTRAMERKLRDVDAIDVDSAKDVLELPDKQEEA